jgi:hypothetical protein
VQGDWLLCCHGANPGKTLQSHGKRPESCSDLALVVNVYRRGNLLDTEN